MADIPVPAELKGFHRLSRSTYIYEPTTTAAATSPAGGPDLILLSSWLDAQPRHIAKYTTNYQQLFPHARILLITSNFADVTYRSWSSLYADWSTTSELIRTLPKSTRILAHAFSNGGSLSLTGLARRHKETTGTPLSLPVLVLDSTPGALHWDKAVAALAAGLPKNPLVRLIAGLLIRAFLIVTMLADMVKGSKDSIMIMRAELNDTGLFEGDTKRLYFFSDSDQVILDKDVRVHAEEAREKSWDVTLEEFRGTAHVSHMMGDASRYWAAIKKAWESAV